MRGTGLAAVAALMTLGLAATVLPAQAQSAAPAGVTGRNVLSVDFDGGRFQRQPDGSWAELDSAGRIAFRFRETARDDWSVYLAEIGADKQIQLDLYRMMITIAQGGAPRSDLYVITDATAPRLPGTLRPVTLPAPTPSGDGLTIGTTLRRVTFADGYFQQSGSGADWTEYNARGAPVYYFRERSRSPEAVTLFDASRNTGLEFDMRRQMVRISWSGAPYEDLYPIVSTRHQADGGRGNVPPPDQLRPVSLPPGSLPAVDYAAQEAFKIEAGPITSQSEAGVACPALANRLGGEWRNGWERRDGRNSICVIHFRR